MRRFLGIFLFVMYAISLHGHDNVDTHFNDIAEVFGFAPDKAINSGLYDWVYWLSGEMIDGRHFHEKLDKQYKGLNIKSPNNHRYLFHWGWKGKPWNKGLEKFIKSYCKRTNKDESKVINDIRLKIKKEDDQRNQWMINSSSNKTFKFSKNGQDGIYLEFFISMGYSIHLLGDYTPDNKRIGMLQPFDKLIDQIQKSLTSIDRFQSSLIVLKLKLLNRSNQNVQQKAEKIMTYLKQSVPPFIKKVKSGTLVRRLEKHGFVFV
ncbi:MAG: hypothetical protein IKH14_04110 [Prevotella sp.]|nr:hypothetical protein [Prevotella sp.]